MSKKQQIAWLVLAAVLILGGVSYGLYYSWQNTGGCISDTKLCLDGSFVSRVGRNCEFAKCPFETSKPAGDINQKVCTMEAKLCPDGSAVGRSGANCEFAECPKAVEDQKACRTAEDCACGTKINTNECFFGNRKYVNIEKQCPDYCTGITGRLTIGCVDGLCQQIDNKAVY